MSDENSKDPEYVPQVFGGGVSWAGRAMSAQERLDLTSRPMPSLRAAPPQIKSSRATQQEFCQIVATTGNIGTACLAVGCTRRSVERLRKADPDFDEAVCEALDAFAGVIEGEAVRRATEGVEKPIVSGGVVIAVQREFSDALLIALLKRTSPEWRAALASGSQTSVNVTASATAGAAALAGVTPEALPERIRGMDPAQRDALRAALQLLSPSAAGQLAPSQHDASQQQAESVLDVEAGAETKLEPAQNAPERPKNG